MRSTSESYQPPSLEALFDVKSLTSDYKRSNEEHIEILRRQRTTKTILEETHHPEAQAIMVGAYLYGYQVCGNYAVFSPTFKRGKFFDTGSQCFTICKTKLNISKDNPISNQEILMYLAKFYNFVKTHASDYEGFIKDLVGFLKDVKKELKNIFNKNKLTVLSILKAIPSELALDNAIKNLLQNYLDKTKANNQERKRHIQLLQALNETLPIKLEEDNIFNFIPRRQRMKMGYVLFLLHEINDSYWIRSPKGNSAAYDLGCQAINIESLVDMDANIQFACLTAFKSLLCDNKFLTKLEKQFNHDRMIVKQPTIYIDTMTYRINQRLEILLNKFTPSENNFELSSFTLSCITVASLCLSAPGYGVGYVVGWGLGLTDPMVTVKQSLSSVTDFGMRVIFGKNGSYITFLPSEMVIDTTLERGFAKVFEALGMLIGGVVAGVFAFTIKECTYDTLKNLCHLYTSLHDKYKPKLAKDVDLNLLECLMSIPNEFFENNKKQKIQSMITYQKETQEKIEMTNKTSPLLK